MGKNEKSQQEIGENKTQKRNSKRDTGGITIMNHISIRDQRSITNLSRNVNLHNGSIVVLKNTNVEKNNQTAGIYYVTSFRDNGGTHDNVDSCRLLDLDIGDFAFKEPCSRNTTVRRILRHLFHCSYTRPYNPNSKEHDQFLSEYDIDVFHINQYNMEIVLNSLV